MNEVHGRRPDGHLPTLVWHRELSPPRVPLLVNNREFTTPSPTPTVPLPRERDTLAVSRFVVAVAQTTGVVRRTQTGAGVSETGVVCGLLCGFDRLVGLI